MWNQVIRLFHAYMGEGLIIGWFLLAEIYLFVREKDRNRRILFVYTPLTLLLLFFNPLFAEIFYGIAGEEIYYRILWLIPITLVIAYGGVQLIFSYKRGKKGGLGILLAFLIMLSGKYVYSSPFFEKAQNIYHVPQSVVEICDAIAVEGREVMAVFPSEQLQYVRQYAPTVCMPYGREALVSAWGPSPELYDAMEAESIDAGLLVSLAREEGCHYIILRSDKEIKGSLGEGGYIRMTSIRGYDVYKDETVDLYDIFG